MERAPKILLLIQILFIIIAIVVNGFDIWTYVIIGLSVFFASFNIRSILFLRKRK